MKHISKMKEKQAHFRSIVELYQQEMATLRRINEELRQELEDYNRRNGEMKEQLAYLQDQLKHNFTGPTCTFHHKDTVAERDSK